jgi:L-seryl-tRNA(Ser) seleniumtransferase
VLEGLVEELTGAEAGIVFCSDAVALLATLAALASGREVVVSRGHLIEVDEACRMPEIIGASGASICEVGTANRTRAADYVAAMGPGSAAVVFVETYNFTLSGFAAQATLREVLEVGRRHPCPVIHCMGPAALMDLQTLDLARWPSVAQSIGSGVDLVVFRGDGLLGGPRCGIVAGRRSLVEQVARHPFARSAPLDKLGLAALVATLRLYRSPERGRLEVPVMHLLGASIDNLRNRAERLAPQLAAVDGVAEAQIIETTSSLGSPALVRHSLPTVCIAVQPAQLTAERLAARLRAGMPALLGRVEQERLLLDLRSVLPRQDAAMVEAVAALAPSQEQT